VTQGPMIETQPNDHRSLGGVIKKRAKEGKLGTRDDGAAVGNGSVGREKGMWLKK
jgi:hypothetical protein